MTFSCVVSIFFDKTSLPEILNFLLHPPMGKTVLRLSGLRPMVFSNSFGVFVQFSIASQMPTLSRGHCSLLLSVTRSLDSCPFQLMDFSLPSLPHLSVIFCLRRTLFTYLCPFTLPPLIKKLNLENVAPDDMRLPDASIFPSDSSLALKVSLRINPVRKDLAKSQFFTTSYSFDCRICPTVH